MEVADEIGSLIGKGRFSTKEPVTPLGVPGKVPSWAPSASHVWHWIFGSAHRHASEPKLTQAQINDTVAAILGQLNVQATVLHLLALESTDNAQQFVLSALQADYASLLSQIGAVQAGAAGVSPAVARAINAAKAAAIGAALTDADNAYTRAVHVAQGLYNEAIAHASAGDHAVLGEAQHLYNLAVARADADYLKAVHVAQGLYNRTNDNLGKAFNALDRRMADQRNTLEGEIRNGVGTAETYTRDLVAGLGVPALAAGLGAATQAITKLATQADECLEPLCDTVTPNARQLGNLGKLLAGLNDVGLLGLMTAFFAEAVADPHLAATEVDDTLGPVAGAAAAELRDLLGL